MDETTAPEAPGGTAPEAPGNTAPEAPGNTAPEAPGNTAPEAPGNTAPEATGGAAPENAAPDASEAPGAAPERYLLIIGAMKSGTTTLFEYLAQHPQIARSRIKEPNLFGRARSRRQFEERRRRLWPDFDPARHRYAMEASTHYTKAPRHRNAVARIAALGAGTRLIYIVRDPVERIESNLAHNIAQGRIGHAIDWEDPTFARAIDVSRYGHQLGRYAKALPPEAILVLDFEEMKRDPLAMLGRCVDFLGLDPGFAFTPIPPANTRKSANAGDRFRLSEELRARLRAELAPDARRFAAAAGFDISPWGLGEAQAGEGPGEVPAEAAPAPAPRRRRAPAPAETPLLFHIGMAKTGSSALQRALFGSEAYLAAKGVIYPHNPARPSLHNHKLIATKIAPLDELPRHMARLGPPERVLGDAEAFLAALAALVAERRPGLLLLSSETMFMPIRPDRQAAIRSAFARIGSRSPRFVAYLRRPGERYASGLQQAARRSSAITQPRAPKYRATITSYEEVFGAGCVGLHVFHRPLLKDGDVVADFVARHLAERGVEASALAQVGERNVSLSAEAIQAIQAFRRRFGEGQGGAEGLRGALRQADIAVGGGRLRLIPAIADMVDYARADPLWLRDRFGVVFPNFDYRRLEEGRLAAPPARELGLEEILAIDPARREALLAHLAGSDWAAARPDRAAWLADLRRELAAA